MRGLGTLINVAAIIVGSLIGMAVKNGIKPRFQQILVQACGIATIFIGAAGALSGLLYVDVGGRISSQNILLLVFSMVAGGLIGEAIQIETRMEAIGEKLKLSLGRKNDTKFVEGFVTVTLITCVGAMAIVGSIQDGLTGDASMLITKSLLDFVIVMVFASTLGLGVLFSAIPLGLYQGGITLFAVMIADYMNEYMITNLSSIGSVLIFGVGINLAFGKKIPVANFLPALFVPIIYSLFFT